MYFNSHPLLLMNKQYEKMQVFINPDPWELVMDTEGSLACCRPWDCKESDPAE